jgi:hypothetical protein
MEDVSVNRTNQELGSVQLVRHDLKMQERVAVKAVLPDGAQFHRALGIGADVERELIVVVALPNPERETDLFQIVDACKVSDLGLESICILVAVPIQIQHPGGCKQRCDEHADDIACPGIHSFQGENFYALPRQLKRIFGNSRTGQLRSFRLNQAKAKHSGFSPIALS